VKRLLAALVFLLFTALPGVANAQQGQPLTPLDADFLIKVKYANLWEIPAGQMAQERSVNPKVQEAGRVMMTDHAQLDIAIRPLAARYNLALPAQAMDIQKSWLSEMAAASGSDFDSVYAMRLRAAHGVIFAQVGQVRAETHDPDIRKFADTANTIVLRHMTLLEATGSVDFNGLYDPTPLLLKTDSDGVNMVVALTLVPLVVAITVFVLWMAAGRRSGRRNVGPRRPEFDQDEDEGPPRGTRSGGGSHRNTKLFTDKEYAR
jgi:predicted outer membrane protein